MTPFCVFCSKRFNSAGALRTHLKRHTGEKTYFCEVCPQEFCTRSEKSEHVLESHPEAVVVVEPPPTTAGGSSTASLSEEQSAEYQCPVCKKIPPGEIFQCKNGHTLCDQCYPKVYNCPQPGCRSKFASKIRCLALENILDRMGFPCPNQNKECDAVVKRGQIKDHLETCDFRELKKLCSYLGFPCRFESSASAIVERTLVHWEQRHGFIIIATAGHAVNITHEGLGLFYNPRQKLPSPEVSWTPVVLKMDQRAAAVVLSKTKGQTLQIRCVLVGKEEISGKVEASFSIKMKNGGSSEILQGRITPRKIAHHGNKLDTEPAFTIPLTGRRFDGFTLTVNMIEQEPRPGSSRAMSAAAEDVIALPVVSNRITKNSAKCDGCGMTPLIPVRYKCLQCEDYDLCQACMKRERHSSHHVFAMLRNDSEQQHLLQISRRLPYGASILPFVPIPPPTLFSWSNVMMPPVRFDSEKCTGCGVRSMGSVKFACLTCPAADYCKTCVESGVHQHHIFGVIFRYSQSEFLRRLQKAKFPRGLIPKMKW